MDSIPASIQKAKSPRIRTLWIAALFAILFSLVPSQSRASDIAAGEAEARRVVKTLGESLLAALKINDLDARRRMLLTSAAPAVDFKTLGANVLAHAQVQVPQGQRAEIMEGLTAYIARTIMDEIEQVHPRDAKLGASTVKTANEVRVAMALAGPNRTIDADWVVKNSDAGWRVTDIFVSGYSLAGHYGAILGRRVAGSVEQLADMMSAEKKRAPKLTEFARVEKAVEQRPAQAPTPQRIEAAYPQPAAQPVTFASVTGEQQRAVAPTLRAETAQPLPPSYRMAQMNQRQPEPQAARPAKRPADNWRLDLLTDLLRD